MLESSPQSPSRTHNVVAAYEFGLSRQMFGYGLAYQRYFADWAFDEVDGAPVLAHDRLGWAIDRLGSMLSPEVVRTLSEQLRGTRTLIDKAKSSKDTKTLLASFLDITRGVLANYWTLLPWYALGDAVGQCYRELMVAASSKMDACLVAGEVLRSALAQLPPEALGQSGLLKSIVDVAADANLAESLVELGLVLEEPTFWAKSANSYRNTLVYNPEQKRMEVLGLPSTVMNAEVAWERHRKSAAENWADSGHRRMYSLWTIDRLERSLFEILHGLTDAPVLAFDNQNEKAIAYNGGLREARSHFQQWLHLLYDMKGQLVTEGAAKASGRLLSSTELRVEKRSKGNDPLLRSLVETRPPPKGGSRLLALEPVTRQPA